MHRTYAVIVSVSIECDPPYMATNTNNHHKYNLVCLVMLKTRYCFQTNEVGFKKTKRVPCFDIGTLCLNKLKNVRRYVKGWRSSLTYNLPNITD